MQEREGGTLGALVSRLLTQAIAQRRRPSPPASLTWVARPMRPLFDLSDKDAVYAALDDGPR